MDTDADITNFETADIDADTDITKFWIADTDMTWTNRGHACPPISVNHPDLTHHKIIINCEEPYDMFYIFPENR